MSFPFAPAKQRPLAEGKNQTDPEGRADIHRKMRKRKFQILKEHEKDGKRGFIIRNLDQAMNEGKFEAMRKKGRIQSYDMNLDGTYYVRWTPEGRVEWRSYQSIPAEMRRTKMSRPGKRPQEEKGAEQGPRKKNKTGRPTKGVAPASNTVTRRGRTSRPPGTLDGFQR